jgi:thioredoxin-related protein
MKTLLIIISFIVFSFSIFAQDQNYGEPKKFDPNRNPEADLKVAVEYADSTGKRIILDVGGEWCIWCHRIDAFIENNKEIKSLIEKNFIVLKINYSKENKNENFLSKYPDVQGYPHFFVLDKKGKLLHSQNTGELEKDKDYDAEKFITFLKKWSPAQ